MKKHSLRKAARFALSQRFGAVNIVRAQGVLPGARLAYRDGELAKEASVRTSNEREVGLLRDRRGDWRTLSKVQLVLVAVPKRSADDVIEVLAFDPSDLKAEFDRFVKVNEKANRSLARFKAPVFLPIDASNKNGTKHPGLRSIPPLWTTFIKEQEVPLANDVHSEREAAIETIRAGIAKGLGVELSRVELTFSFKLLP